jgi:hypothetical protein
LVRKSGSSKLYLCSVAELHHFDAASVPDKIFDAAPAPDLLNNTDNGTKPTFLKQAKVNVRVFFIFNIVGI